LVTSGLRLDFGQNQYAFEDFTLKDAGSLWKSEAIISPKEKENLYMEGNL